MSSTSPDYTTNHIENVDQLFPNYPRDFVEFALFNQEFFDNAQYVSQGDEGSPNIGLFVDEAPLTVQESTDKGDSCSAVTKGRRDRSKTIVTERKRRVRMKERLYELRALVPNITKMDKASIIVDAVEYVRNLQSQAKMLEDEISMLEFSFIDEDQVLQNLIDSTQFEESTNTTARNGAMIWQIDAFEIGNRRYMVTMECENRNQAAVSLYSAIESLSCFHLDNSNLTLNSNKFIATLTLSIKEYEGVMNASTLYLELVAALLEKGFQLAQPQFS
ncbi:transcription factor FER-LIKE IRON DEFICIENCY-INDUCED TRANSCRIPTION FACTOR [Carex littledalei]|uniref:Transcription factor FER-LIKE IRON DEFICIENCY-INDUCED TRANSCRIPTION FACTOR n=1 Tax=Carex littledalei TaxID=544730 RepID=A0A833VF80_9POAL|nr:transcription factor FER-LIKE IRON DEFICIENCY-INDUCED TRANSCRIPTION FACTOR [Carex littledalei]